MKKYTANYVNRDASDCFIDTIWAKDEQGARRMFLDCVEACPVSIASLFDENGEHILTATK